ncbi:MAG: putative dsRNA-binding protein [Bacteroidota bacterium]|nr:putative dsRNA-binding protein [Bacteroidota bacterium]
MIDEVGDGYNKQYIVQVLINKKAVSQARDYSIKGAEQIASEKACNTILKD